MCCKRPPERTSAHLRRRLVAWSDHGNTYTELYFVFDDGRIIDPIIIVLFLLS